MRRAGGRRTSGSLSCAFGFIVGAAIVLLITSLDLRGRHTAHGGLETAITQNDDDQHDDATMERVLREIEQLKRQMQMQIWLLL